MSCTEKIKATIWKSSNDGIRHTSFPKSSDKSFYYQVGSAKTHLVLQCPYEEKRSDLFQN